MIGNGSNAQEILNSLELESHHISDYFPEDSDETTHSEHGRKSLTIMLLPFLLS